MGHIDLGSRVRERSARIAAPRGFDEIPFRLEKRPNSGAKESLAHYTRLSSPAGWDLLFGDLAPQDDPKAQDVAGGAAVRDQPKLATATFRDFARLRRRSLIRSISCNVAAVR